MTVPEGGLFAWEGKAAGQVENSPKDQQTQGQYLEGGKVQLFIDLKFGANTKAVKNISHPIETHWTGHTGLHVPPKGTQAEFLNAYEFASKIRMGATTAEKAGRPKTGDEEKSGNTMTMPTAVKMPLQDGAYQPDSETPRKTFWLHRRHTSVTYISRMLEMLEAFTKGFGEYVAKDPDPGIFASFLQVCHACLNELREGIARVRSSDHSGFKLIRGAMSFRIPFYSRVYEYDFRSLGFNRGGAPNEGLWLWMEKVIPMSLEIEGALWGQFSYPLFDVSKFIFPDQIGGYPPGKNVSIKDGWVFP